MRPRSLGQLGFNPCCHGSGSLTRLEVRRRLYGRKVSILVVVDLARVTGHGLPASWATAMRCFNPCCRGSGSLTSIEQVSRELQKVFQSLLSWIGRVNDPGHRPGTISTCFNPCCRGSGSRHPSFSASVLPLDPGFNPCCRGSGSRDRGRPALLPSILFMFQSLLSWIWLGDSGSEPYGHTSIGFNPCCRGSGWLTEEVCSSC